MRIFKIGLFSFCLIAFSCKVGDNQQSMEKKKVPFYVYSFFEKFEESTRNYSFVINEDETKVLCTRFTVDIYKTFEYAIFDIESQKEIYSSGFIGSEIYWKNINEVEIKGASRVNPDETIIVNVLTQQSRVGSQKKTN